MSFRRRRRSRLGLVVRLLVVVAVLGGALGAGAVATNAFGAGERWDNLLDRVALILDPPPDLGTDDEVVTGRPTAPPSVAPSEPAEPTPTLEPGATPTPAPTPTPPPVREAVDVDLLRDAGIDAEAKFASQVENDMCAPSGVQMALAVLDLVDTRPETQLAIHGRVEEWESRQDSQNGNWGPFAMAKALDAYGAPGYRVRVYETREDALYDAALAIRTLGKPVILLTWKGAHTWVMTGYRADADPAAFPDAQVSGAYILDPWYPRNSSIWGPSDPPGTFQDASEMERNYLPWDRPEGSYGGRDGKWVAVVPTTPLDAAS